MKKKDKLRGFSTKWEDHLELVYKLCHQVNSRVKFSKVVGICFEDLVQESGVAYTKCLKRYRPELGITFSAYFGRSILNRLNYFVGREIDIRGIATVSMDEEDIYELYRDNSDGDASVRMSECEVMVMMEDVYSSMTPDAIKVLTLFSEVPEMLRQEHIAALCKQELERQGNITGRKVPDTLTVTFVAENILHFSRARTQSVRRELKGVMDAI